MLILEGSRTGPRSRPHPLREISPSATVAFEEAPAASALELTGREMHPKVSIRGVARYKAAALGATVLVATLGIMLLAVAAPVAMGSAATRVSGGLRFRAGLGVSPSTSTRVPRWACPNGPCEAIVDPHPVKTFAGYALPGGPLLEGGGELGGFDPEDLQSAYAIPASGGSTQTVAVIEEYGYPAAESDLAQYRARYGLPPCTKANGCFKKINEDGEEHNYPSEEEPGWQRETALDLDMVSAACPSCHVMLAETDEGLFGLAPTVTAAVNAGATEVSNSYGVPEQFCNAVCSALEGNYSHAGVVITASAGDTGFDSFYEGASSPSFPADLPSVIAVGGTSLSKAANARGWTERVWNEPSRSLGTGGGCSTLDSKPPWQQDAACAGRLGNDVAAVAACETPVSVYTTVEGGWSDVCGTSASAPLLAGILAHTDAETRALGARAFYEIPSVFDVTEGTSGTCTPPATHQYFCTAGLGYDGPTGLGTPDGVPSSSSVRVTGVEPEEGPLAGGATVTITGKNFTGALSVKFGPSAAAEFAVESDTTITAVTPPGTGTVDVRVSTPDGTSGILDADRYTYAPPPTVHKLSVKKGPAAGGTPLTIKGSGFTPASIVRFAGVQAGTVTFNSASSLSTTSPAGAAGLADVTVTTIDGTSATSASDRFKYGTPTIAEISPNTGPTAGGTVLTITGTGFAPGVGTTGFVFRRTSSGSVQCATTTQCTVVAPPAAKAGVLDVKAQVGKVKSKKTQPADQFTYQ